MNLAPSEHPEKVHVHIALPEMLVAMGIRAALCGQPALDVRIIDCGDTEVPEVAGGVIVTDYPHGLNFLRRIQTRTRCWKDAPARVLVMSARDREHEIRFALEEGVHGYLSVSCSQQEIAEAVLTLSRGLRYISAAVAVRVADSLGRESLTLREHEVLALLASGECNKLIARRLDIAIGTVKSHVKSIMHKLGASSRTKAVSIANERGMIDFAELVAASEPFERPTQFA